MLDPSLRIALDGQRIDAPGFLADESTVIGDFAVPEKTRQQGKSVLRKHGVDILLLPYERFRGTTGRQRISGTQPAIDNLRVKFIDTPQAHGVSPAVRPRWFAEHELPRAGVIS